VTASSDGSAKNWDANTGQRLLTLKASARGEVHSAAFNRDGIRILTAADDGTVRVFERVSGKETLVLRGSLRQGLCGRLQPFER